MVSSERSSQRFYDRLGASGLAELALDEKTRADLRLVFAWAQGTRDVLDLACGYGRITLPLAARGFNVRGIDLSGILIRDARKRARAAGLSIGFQVGSMVELPYEDASFDRVFCLWSSFNHLLNARDQRAALNEMHRVLRPGGLAVVEAVNGATAPLRRKMRVDGFGPRRRLLEWRMRGATITHFIHDAETLSATLKRTKFSDFDVKLATVFHHRRLIAIARK